MLIKKMDVLDMWQVIGGTDSSGGQQTMTLDLNGLGQDTYNSSSIGLMNISSISSISPSNPFSLCAPRTQQLYYDDEIDRYWYLGSAGDVITLPASTVDPDPSTFVFWGSNSN